MKIKEFFTKNKKRILTFCILTLLFLIALICILSYNPTSEIIDVAYVNQLLTESSELTTAKLTITAMSEYKDSGVKILNRSDFIMVYNATIEAGIEMDKINITAPNELTKTIHIEVPEAIIQSAKVDPKNIKYFDEKFALFNVDSKEDANKAMALAEESAKNEAAKTGILELANKQSETLIKGIIENAIPDDYTIKISKIKS